MMSVFKEFSFDAAHYLPYLPEGHKCRGLHGHTYRLKVFVSGSLDDDLGWLLNFTELKKIVLPVINLVDHKLLNEVDGLDNPTCEILTVWFWKKIKPALPQLNRVELYETLTSGAVYTG